MRKRLFAILTATSLLTSLLTGCGAENTTTSQTESIDPSITAKVEPTEEVTTEEQIESEATEQPTETVETTEEPTPEQAEESEATTESTEKPAPQYTYTDMSATMYAKQSVNVRDLPTTDGNKLGGLSASQEVTVTGQCKETSWYRIEYNGGTGYVSNSYLVNEKPVVEEKPTEQPTQATDSNGLSYTVNQWGTKVFDVEPNSVDEVLALTSLTMGVGYHGGDNYFYFYELMNNGHGDGVGFTDGFMSALSLAQSMEYNTITIDGKTSQTVERYGYFEIVRRDCYAE